MIAAIVYGDGTRLGAPAMVLCDGQVLGLGRVILPFPEGSLDADVFIELKGIGLVQEKCPLLCTYTNIKGKHSRAEAEGFSK